MKANFSSLKSEGEMKKKDTHKPTYFVQSVDRAMDILECFTFSMKELAQSEIVRQTGLNRTTAVRLLSHLTNRGYLHYNAQDRNYHLGPKLLELGGIAMSSISLRKIAAPYLRRLCNETGHTIMLGIRIEDSLVYADKHDGQGVLFITSEIGVRKPLHFGMLGIMLMAYLPKEEQEYLLDKDPLQAYASKSITDRKAFMREMAGIRENGYYIGDEDAFEGVGGISAPVRDYQGKVVAALGITMMVSVLRKPGVEAETIKRVTETALAISEKLGYSET